MQTVFNVQTPGPGLYEFTGEVVRFVLDSGLREELLKLFVQHTSCSLLVQENADPDEGPDDMPGHIKASLTAVSLSIPVTDGRERGKSATLRRSPRAGLHYMPCAPHRVSGRLLCCLR